MKDSSLKDSLLNRYKKAIISEQEKIKKADNITRTNGQTSGIDFESTFSRIEEMATKQFTR